MRVTLLLACTLLAFACGGDGADPVEPNSKRPHIVLITADTLRADHLSCYGYAREASPDIDAFAQTATRYADAITVIPKTCPSFATMFTGLHPDEHRVRHNRVRLPDDAPRVAEVLAARGYRTAAFIGNPVLRAEVGLSRGFETYELFPEDDAVPQALEAFLEWSAQPWDRPTFVWIHFIDPHGPYDPPGEFAELFVGDELDQDDRRVPVNYQPTPGLHPNKVLGAIPIYQQHAGEDRAADYVRRYDAEIRYMDDAFGRVMGELRERSVLDDSAVLFLSDHGESLGEHDYWFEHGWFAYDATLHVPLIVKEPGQDTGAVVEQQVSTLDLFPTLVDFAGLTPRERLGVSLVGAEPPAGREVLIENSGAYPLDILGVRRSDRKFLVQRSGVSPELYDLDADPDEAANLYSPGSADVSEARAALVKRRAALLEPGDLAGRATTDETLTEQMQRLGYE